MFEEITVAGIKAELLTDVAAACGGISTQEGGFLDTLVGKLALEHWKLYQSLNAVVPIAYVDESSGGYIDLRCGEYGILRKPGTQARAALTLTGRAGTVVPAGTVFLTASGLEFALLEPALLGADGTATGEVEAAALGAAYNVAAGALVRMYVNLAGLERWQNEAAEGGTDGESDSALVARLYAYLQKPATSGNVYHYEQWARSVPGVGAAKVTPLWAGAGTVRVLLVDENRAPAADAIVEAAEAYIETMRPVGAAVTVQSAAGLVITVAATVGVDTSTTVAAVQAAFVSNLDTYIKTLVFQSNTLLYNRVAFLLLSVPGVLDYTSLTVNGGTGNVSIEAEQVPVLGEVTVQ